VVVVVGGRLWSTLSGLSDERDGVRVIGSPGKAEAMSFWFITKGGRLLFRWNRKTSLLKNQ